MTAVAPKPDTRVPLVRVQTWPRSGPRLAAFDPPLWEALALTEGALLRLRAGRRAAWVRAARREPGPAPPRDRVGASAGAEPVLALSRDILDALCLQGGMRLGLRREALLPGGYAGETGLDAAGAPRVGLALGPIVGILARSPGPLLRPYLAAAAAMAVPAFVFGPADVRWRRGVILGAVPAPGGWRRVPCPIPDVVYDRAIGRWREERRGSLLALLRRHGAAVFNGAVGYKWHIHRMLWAHEPLLAHLPVTRPLRSPADAAGLLQRFGGIYLKPDQGFGGDGIVVVRTGPGRGYMIAGRGALRTGPAGLVRCLRQLIRRRAYIVQQELPLVRWRGRRFDVRVLMLRDGSGRWQVGGTAVRVGAAGSLVSNLRRGGRARDPAVVLAEAVAACRDGTLPVEGLLAAIHVVALAAAQAVARAVPAAGELGIDIGLDAGGHPWVIEVNPKPGRKSFARDDTAVRRRVYGLPFAYACHLAGWPERPEKRGWDGSCGF